VKVNRLISIAVYVPIILAFLAGLLDFLNLFSRIPHMQWLRGHGAIVSFTDLILFLTLLAIVSYTFETYRLRVETQRMAQTALEGNKAASRPALLIRWFRSKEQGWMLILTNQGKGTALNIECSVTETEYSLDWEGVNAIYQGDTVPVLLLKNGLRLSTEDLAALGTNPITIIIRCGSVDNLSTTLVTKVEVRNQPATKIIEAAWQ
jgi:hypothetical protein